MKAFTSYQHSLAILEFGFPEFYEVCRYPSPKLSSCKRTKVSGSLPCDVFLHVPRFLDF